MDAKNSPHHADGLTNRYRPILPRFRSRWAVGIQITAMICMLLQPLTVNSYWSDTNGDGTKEWVEDPPAGDSWWDQDSDGDLMTNAEEALFGSDPYRIDSDFDGLTDKDERDLGPLFSGGLPTDPWQWSSTGSGVSDYDAYYQYLQGITPQVNYQSLAGSNTPFYSYYDADGDGTHNPFDSEPLGNDIDGDGLLNWQDSYMTDPNNGAGTGGGTPQDSDADGIPDESDPFPWGSYTFNGVEYGGSWTDADNDGIPNPADPFPNGSYTYGGIEYEGTWIDSDNDGIPDPADSTPFPPNSYWYNGTEYPGEWQDDDGDGVPNPADNWPNDSWNGQPHYNYNGTEYAGEWSDRDGDNVPDPADAWPDDPENGADNDGDGISNYEENTSFQTNPGLVDSDGDYLTDYEELFVYYTNPLNPRSQNPILLDWLVVDQVDADADLIPDRVESFYGLNPQDAMDAHGDLDGDGVSNVAAYQAGLSLTLNTSHYDVDFDGIPDVVEDYWAVFSAGLMSKSDPDDATADPDNDGVLNYEEVRYGLNPTLPSTNGTATDLAFVNMAFGLLWQKAKATGDTDGDGMSDRFEHRYGKHRQPVNGLNLRDAKDAGRDPDHDHLSSLNEFRFDSHPLAKETTTGSNDNTRFHTPTPSASIDGGGLLGRYRAQIAADITANNVLPGYNLTDAPPAPPDDDGGGGGGDGGEDPEPPTCGETNCPGCEGTGKKTCDECEGVRPDCSCDGGWIPCPAECASCGGNGKTPGPPCLACVAGCSTCGGQGTVIVECQCVLPGSCDFCFGSGFTTEPCEECPGICNSCGGDGKLPDVDCEECGTSGVCSECFGLAGIPCEVQGCDDGLLPKSCAKCDSDYKIQCDDCGGSGNTGFCKCDQVGCACFGENCMCFDDDDPGGGGGGGGGTAGGVTLLGSTGISSATGQRHRKMGLNGHPMPDSKPQVQDESGEEPEETYIDAFSRDLRHSVSDIYVSLEDSLLPLSVRRDVSQESWSRRSGLRLHERPELAFGPGWTTNICSYVRIEETDDSTRAVVVDEQGAQQSFLWMAGTHWVKSREEIRDPKSAYDRLSGSWLTSFTLKKKFGTVCTYERSQISQLISADRLTGSDAQTSYYYLRLKSVEDRWGNRLEYTYPVRPSNAHALDVSDTIIPSRIHDPMRPGHEIQIEQNAGRVTKVRSPGGKVVTYDYSTRAAIHQQQNLTTTPDGTLDDPFQVLTAVNSGPHSVAYDYNIQTEELHPQIQPLLLNPPFTPVTRYLALKSISENNQTFVFDWSIVNNVLTQAYEDNVLTTKRQRGQPMKLNCVHRSDGTLLNLSGPIFDLSYMMFTEAPIPGVVTTFWNDDHNAETVETQYTYSFANPVFIAPIQRGGISDNYNHKQAAVRYTTLNITATPQSGAGASLTESFSFDSNAGMALQTAVDASGTVTSYIYNDAVPAEGFPGEILRASNYDDPTREITYTNTTSGPSVVAVKTFTYHPGTRIMTSMTDARGTTTLYEVDELGRRTSETIRNSSGLIQRKTLYSFDDHFLGRIAAKKDVSQHPNIMPDTLTQYSLGNPVEVGSPSWWLETHECTGRESAPNQIDSTSCTKTITLRDFDGRKRAVIDPRGFATEFTYDSVGRLSEVIYPDLTLENLADNPRKLLGYDLHGNLTSETDELGTTTFHAYDALNRRVSSTVDLNGNGQADFSYTEQGVDVNSGTPTYNGDISTFTTYNSRGQVLTQTDARGKVTTNTYDIHGRLKSTNDGGLVTSYQYGINSGGSLFDTSGFKPTQVTAPNGLVTNITYDAMYRPLTKSSTIGGTTTTVYDAGGNPISVKDPLNRVTTHEYDALGQCVKTTFPGGAFVQQFYTHHGKVWKSVNEMGAETVTTYDAIGRAVAVFQPSAAEGEDGAVTTTEYDVAGNVIQVTDSLGRVTYSTYDERNRPVSIHAARVWDSVGGAFVWPQAVTTYDAAGRVTSVTDHTGAVVRKSYDAAGRLWKSTDPLNHATFSTYDPNGNVLTVTDALNRTVTNVYDTHNRLEATLDAAGIENKFEYDAAGNRTKVIDGLEQATEFEYDLLGRLTSQTFANDDTWTHAYNEVHKTSQTDPKGITTSYTYDARDRLLTSSAPGLVRTRSYDACGRLLSVTEADRPEATVVNTYDVLGRLKTETSRGVLHSYFYDLVGNRVRAEYGTGQVVETSYDALNRPETITQGEQMTRYGYDLAGRAVMLIGGNGQVTENTYDAAGRLTNRVMFRSLMEREQDDVMAEFGWAHDAVGNVATQHEVWPGSADRAAGVRATAMTYDGANRLETETITDPEQGVTATTYVYDDANNRDTKTVTGGSEPGFWDYTYNVANQLTAWEKRSAPAGTLMKSASLGYDGNGNRTSQTVTEVATATTSVTAYHWDAQDRLSAVVMPDASVHSYDYDYRTRRTGTHETTATSAKHTTIAFAGGLSLAEWETENSEPITANPPTVEYTRGPDMGGGVGGMLYSKRGETHKYSLSNGRGDIVAQSDSGGELTWTASYEAYGKRTKETGTNADKQRANTKDEDPTGLLNEGFRYRDIETGVWLSRDPAGFVDGPNLYAYVMQNPWSKWDPDGLWWRDALSTGLDFIPGVSTIKSAVEFVAGQDLITGEAISRAESAASLGASFIPGGKGALKIAKMGAKMADKAFEVQGKAETLVAAAEEVSDGGNVSLATAAGLGMAIIAGKKGGRDGGDGPRKGGGDGGGPAPKGEGPFVPDEYWTRNAPANVTPGTKRLDHTKYNATTKQLEESRVIYDDYGRQTFRVDKTDHGRPTGNGHPNDPGHTNPHLHESTYAPKGTQGHNEDTGRKEVLHNLNLPIE